MNAAAPNGRRARATDVAIAAGVSISTVSLVVNGKWAGRVNPQTAARVAATVEQLGYTVDLSARHLATGASSTVAVIAPAFTNPFYARVSVGAAEALGDRYQLVFPVPGAAADQPSAWRRVLAMRLDGAIVAAPSAAVLDQIPANLPIVVLDSPNDVPGRHRVNLDVQAGAVSAARHLTDLGHRHVAFMAGRPETDTLALRRLALADQLASNGARLIDIGGFASVVDSAAALDVARARLDDLLAAGITAIVCATDLHAYGVMRALGEAGLRVPADVSVVGFDDQPLSAFLTPALTTVSFPAHELGRVGGMVLDALVTAGGARDVDRVVTLPTQLMVRGSTGPASGSS
ncbi:MAG: LacI family transcriptional regulator [Ilumatobacteraceae bacterium]|nr:LacI family transcriptional regulator [Ilumatobacteraceae bacterium]